MDRHRSVAVFGARLVLGKTFASLCQHGAVGAGGGALGPLDGHRGRPRAATLPRIAPDAICAGDLREHSRRPRGPQFLRQRPVDSVSAHGPFLGGAISCHRPLERDRIAWMDRAATLARRGMVRGIRAGGLDLHRYRLEGRQPRRQAGSGGGSLVEGPARPAGPGHDGFRLRCFCQKLASLLAERSRFRHRLDLPRQFPSLLARAHRRHRCGDGFTAPQCGAHRDRDRARLGYRCAQGMGSHGFGHAVPGFDGPQWPFVDAVHLSFHAHRACAHVDSSGRVGPSQSQHRDLVPGAFASVHPQYSERPRLEDAFLHRRRSRLGQRDAVAGTLVPRFRLFILARTRRRHDGLRRRMDARQHSRR